MHFGGDAMRVPAIAASILSIAIALTCFAPPPHAQSPTPVTGAPTVKRTPLQKFDVTGTSYETIIGIAELAAESAVGRHTHFGFESGYLLEGELTLMIDGQPPKTLKAGDSYYVPAGVAHDAKSGSKSAKVIATYVVEKGKAFATPAK